MTSARANTTAQMRFIPRRPLSHEGPADEPPSSMESVHRSELARLLNRWQVFGLADTRQANTRRILPAVASQFLSNQCLITAFVSAYRCGAVPDSHRSSLLIASTNQGGPATNPNISGSTKMSTQEVVVFVPGRTRLVPLLIGFRFAVLFPDQRRTCFVTLLPVGVAAISIRFETDVNVRQWKDARKSTVEPDPKATSASSGIRLARQQSGRGFSSAVFLFRKTRGKKEEKRGAAAVPANRSRRSPAAGTALGYTLRCSVREVS